MRIKTLILAGAILGAAPLAACAPPAPIAAIRVSDGWAAATPGGARTAAGYLTLTNSGAADDRLVAVSSPRAAHVEIHETAMQGPMTTMRPMAALTVPAHGSAALKQGGAHLMFIDIAGPFAAGDAIPVTLTFEKAGAVQTTLPVRAP